METAMTDAPKLVRLTLTRPAAPAIQSIEDALAALLRVTWDPRERPYCRIQDCSDRYIKGALILTEHELRMVLILPLCRCHADAISRVRTEARSAGMQVPFRMFRSPQDAEAFLDEGPHVKKKERGPQGHRPDDQHANTTASNSGAPGGTYGSSKAVYLTARASVQPDRTQSLRAREENARRAEEMRAKYADPGYLDKLAAAPRRPGHVQGLAEIEAANKLVDAAAAAKAKQKNNSKKGDKDGKKK